MRVVPLTPEVAPAWNVYVALHRGGWFWHRADWLAYEVAHAGAENLSFGVADRHDLLGVCPILREGDRFSMEGHPLPITLIAGTEARDAAEAEVRRLAGKHGIRSMAFRTCPLVEAPNLEGAQGGRDLSWPSRILDLTQSEATLHAGVRKSYRHLINRGYRTWEIVVGAGLAKPFHDLWAEVNGQRRAPAAEALMSEWLTYSHEPRAVLIGAERAGRLEGAIYALVYKRAAYYASGPSLMPDVMHMLQWEMIRWLKAMGVTL